MIHKKERSRAWLKNLFTGEKVAKFDKLLTETPQGHIYTNYRLQVLTELLNQISSQRTLEIAAGTGIITQQLLKRGFQVVATDISEDMLNVLRLRVSEMEMNDRCDIQIDDAFALSQADESFDLVVCSSLFTFLDSTEDFYTALCEAGRVLTVGGYFLFNYCNRWSPYNLYSDGREGHSLRTIRKLLDQAGFKMIAKRNENHFKKKKFCSYRLSYSHFLLEVNHILNRLGSPFAWQIYVLAQKNK